MSHTAVGEAAASNTAGLALRWIARVIVICIAAFWIWFGIADGLGDAKTLGPMGFIMMLPAALVSLAVLFVVWRWERVGAYLLLTVSVLGTFAFYENMRRMTLHGTGPRLLESLGLLSVFILPFLIPAILLLIKCRLDRQARPASGGTAATD